MPRVTGRTLELLATLMRTTPLPRWLSARVIETALRDVDFAAAGEPAPYYMPPQSRKTPP